MKKLRKIIIVILLISIIGIGSFIIYKKVNEFKYVKINDKIVEDIKVDFKITEPEKDNKELFDKYRKEYNNDEIVGKISIENTDFNMLIGQSSDNDYYLTHLINREYNALGSTFLDYRNNIDKDRKINIYGHNNGNAGVSFNYMMNYENEDFYNNHKKIVISSDLKDYVFEIFSVQIVDESSGYPHMIVEFNSDEEWYNYIENILDNSLYKEDIDVKKVDRMLTLQTCTNRVDWQFLIINARLVK